MPRSRIAARADVEGDLDGVQPVDGETVRTPGNISASTGQHFACIGSSSAISTVTAAGGRMRSTLLNAPMPRYCSSYRVAAPGAGTESR
jgi:hypothetical protein